MPEEGFDGGFYRHLSPAFVELLECSRYHSRTCRKFASDVV